MVTYKVTPGIPYILTKFILIYIKKVCTLITCILSFIYYFDIFIIDHLEKI